jgi:ubiquitin C-terminal hydrolase
MYDKVKIQNNGDWICPKCEAQNSEHKDNIKKIDKVLCNSCYDEFELDKEESQKNDITIERDCCSNTISVKVNGEETYIMVEDGVDRIAGDIQSILKDLGIESEIIS